MQYIVLHITRLKIKQYHTYLFEWSYLYNFIAVLQMQF